MAEKYNVKGGVFVRAAVLPTFEVSPPSVRQLRVLMEPATNMVEGHIVPLACAGELTEQFAPPAAGYPFGPVVVDHHPVHIQTFGIENQVLVHQAPTEFVQEVPPGIPMHPKDQHCIAAARPDRPGFRQGQVISAHPEEPGYREGLRATSGLETWKRRLPVEKIVIGPIRVP